MKNPRTVAAVAFAVVGVLVCLAGAVAPRIDFFGVGASPEDDHETLRWIFTIPMVFGVAILISQFRSGRWAAGPLLVLLGFGAVFLNDIQLDRRGERIEQIHAQTVAWVEGLPLPAEVTRLDLSDRPASLSSSRTSTGSVSLELSSDGSQAKRFALLDPMLRGAGAEFVRGGCARTETHFRYELEDGRLVELDLGDPRKETSASEITVSYARDSGRRPNGAYISPDEPDCRQP